MLKHITLKDINEHFEDFISRDKLIILDNETKFMIFIDSSLYEYEKIQIRRNLKEWGFSYNKVGCYELEKKTHKPDVIKIPESEFDNFKFKNALMSMTLKHKIDSNGDVNCSEMISQLEDLINTSKEDLKNVKKLISKFDRLKELKTR